MSINIKDVFSMNVFEIFNNKKHLIETYSDKNLVVNLGKYSLCRLLSNNTPENYYIDQMGFGEGTDDPTSGDVGLTNQILVPIIDYTEYGLSTIIFNWELLTHEGNGMMITEYGLFTHGNILFARKIRSAIEKKVNIILEGTWKIVFSSSS